MTDFAEVWRGRRRNRTTATWTERTLRHPATYDDARPFSEGLAAVSLPGTMDTSITTGREVAR